MKVKLSYTVESDQVFAEAAKLFGLRAPLLQEAIDLFTAIQKELESSEEPVNVAQVKEMMIEFRECLVGLDLRSSEVVEIIEGYVNHLAQASDAVSAPVPPPTEGDTIDSPTEPE